MTTMIQNEDAYYDLMFERDMKKREIRQEFLDELARSKADDMYDTIMHDKQSFERYDQNYEFTVSMRQFIWQVLEATDRACNGEQPAIDTILAAASRMQSSLKYAIEEIVAGDME